MNIIVIQAWVKGSPNVVPIAQCESRSTSLAIEVMRLFKREGFRVERFEREEASYESHFDKEYPFGRPGARP